jgi:methionyl-tRNA formyltransferase
MGTPSFSVPSLRAVASAFETVAVVTRPDRPRGRGRQSASSEVACEAERLGLPVLKPEKVNDAESKARLEALTPDLFAVVAYGAILSKALLEVPKLGSINLHGGLLPDYRGASPVQRALWDGRSATGVTTMWIDEGVDTGDLILQEWIAIEAADNAGTLAERLAERGAPLLAESLRLAHAGRAPRTPQDRAAGTYAPRMTKRDGAIDWALDSDTVWNHQRAVTPWPGAVTSLDGRRLIVTAAVPHDRLPSAHAPGTVRAIGAAGVDVACRSGALRLLRVKPEGRAEMSAPDWARGARVAPGAVFEITQESHA